MCGVEVGDSGDGGVVGFERGGHGLLYSFSVRGMYSRGLKWGVGSIVRESMKSLMSERY